MLQIRQVGFVYKSIGKNKKRVDFRHGYYISICIIFLGDSHWLQRDFRTMLRACWIQVATNIYSLSILFREVFCILQLSKNCKITYNRNLKNHTIQNHTLSVHIRPRQKSPTFLSTVCSLLDLRNSFTKFYFSFTRGLRNSSSSGSNEKEGRRKTRQNTFLSPSS